MAEIRKEQKFLALIIPMKDVDGFYDKNPECGRWLDRVFSGYEDYRKALGKKPINDYIIINQDEPYSEEVWNVILKGEKEKEKH